LTGAAFRGRKTQAECRNWNDDFTHAHTHLGIVSDATSLTMHKAR
jgi:hypothetical protein